MRNLSQLKRTAVRFYRARINRVRATIRDWRLAGRLRAVVERDAELAKVKGFHFYIFNGVVTVYGTVRHTPERDLVLGFLRRVQGVREVVGHLNVDEGRTSHTSETIEPIMGTLKSV
jgi:hypothetical protein